MAIVIAIAAVAVAPKFWSTRPAGMPFGCLPIPGSNTVGMQDFSVHMNYLHRILDGSLRHPYQLAGQEQTVRAWSPSLRNGFAHAGNDVNPTSGRPVLKMIWKAVA